MISINAAFSDCIDIILHNQKIIDGELPTWLLTTEVSVSNSTNKDKIISLFKECISFDICDEYILFVVNRTDDEIKKIIDDRKLNQEYQIHKLKKWFEQSDDNKQEIITYLKHKHYNWILSELQGEYHEK
jgi:hypothetical protein